MSQKGSILITDRAGWRKEFPIEKNLVHIGSGSLNDIVLEAGRGAGVAQRHLQLIAMPGEGLRYRAVNLGNADIVLGESGQQVLSPRSMVELVGGERLSLGDFGLVFQFGDAPAGAVLAGGHAPGRSGNGQASPFLASDQLSDAIGLDLSLPTLQLHPERPIEGIVNVSNHGNQPGVQFKLAVEGLDPDCYEIGPGPILFPGVEKGVSLRLEHPRGPEPPAGKRKVQVRAMAPDAYPGASAAVSVEVQILPYFDHALRVSVME